MLKNSNDASCTDRSNENSKKLENKEESSSSTFGSDEFIPIDKDAPSSKVDSKYQRDRSQQKYNHYKNNYYNTNRYASRNGFNGNGSSGNKSGNNSIRGHHYKNTHSNYHGNLTNNYAGANAAVTGYNRTKRKRDSSAISVHGEGQTQTKNVPCADNSNDGSSKISTDVKVNSFMSDAQSARKNTEIREVTQELDEDDNYHNSKDNSIARKKQSKVSLDHASFRNQNAKATKDNDPSRSQIEHGNNEYPGIESNNENICVRSQNESEISQQGIRQSESVKHAPVWYKGKPYGGGAIG